MTALMAATDPVGALDKIRGPIAQRGVGAYTLCARCNNSTGKWYGGAFAAWALQGFELSDRATIAPSLYHIYRIFPLRVMKQIICMFFSSNPSTFQAVQPQLVAFVLDKGKKYLPPHIRIYCFLNTARRGRSTAVTARLQFGAGMPTNVFSEIAFPPFGYVMTIDSGPPDEELIDISWFSHCGYNDWKDAPLKLPILPVYSMLPGDYRSREEIVDQLKAGGNTEPGWEV